MPVMVVLQTVNRVLNVNEFYLIYRGIILSFFKSKIFKLFLVLVSLLAISYAFVNRSVADKPELESFDDKFSYAFGVYIGNNLAQGMPENTNNKPFISGLTDVLEGNDIKLTDEEMSQILEQKQNIVAEKEAEALKEKDAKSAEFFASNQAREGVVTLENGLQYEVLESSTKEDAKQATKESTVIAHYKGTLLNGEEFDSSYNRGEPLEIPLASVIPGWTELVSLMKEGDKWKLYIPSEFAYGAAGAGGLIGPNEPLIFEIELIEVK